MPGGFIGVDIFFVISGYLISLILIDRLNYKSSGIIDFILHFYSRRMQRILPALFAVIIFCVIIGNIVLLPDEYALLKKHIISSLGFFQNFVLWSETGYFDTESELKPLLHIWSLSIEEQFYLIFPVLFWIIHIKSLKIFKIFIFIIIFSFAYSVFLTYTDKVAGFYNPISRFWELLIGFSVAIISNFDKKFSRKSEIYYNIYSFTGFILILFGFFSFNSKIQFPGFNAIVPVFGSALIIIAGPEAFINKKILAFPFFVWIGVISYPLYLWHWPFLSFARIMENQILSPKLLFMSIGLSFLFAIGTYFFIEKPMRRTSPNKTKNIALISFGLALLLFGLTARAQSLHQSPTIEQLRSAFAVPASSNELCRKAFPEIKGDYCLTDKPISPSIVLVGDSHAHALYQGLQDYYKNSSQTLALWGQSSCIPFVGVDRYDFRMKPGDCLEPIKSIIEKIKNTPSIHTVVITSVATPYLLNTAFGGMGWERVERQVVRLETQSETKDSFAVWRIGMRDTLYRLLTMGKKVVYVLDVPELGFAPQACFNMRPIRLTSDLKTPCAVPKKDIDERYKSYRALVYSVLKDYPSVKVFDAATPLCDKDYCWAMKDGYPLYRDFDHLNAEGAQIVSKNLIKIL